VVAAAPRSAAPYELLALLAGRAGDGAAAQAALDTAIGARSMDANVYSARAQQLLRGANPGRAGSTRACRRARRTTRPTCSSDRSRLRPRSRDAYEGLLHALLNVDLLTERDDATLALGRRALPTDGLVVVAQAAVAKQRGDVPAAARLLRTARAEPLTLPALSTTVSRCTTRGSSAGRARSSTFWFPRSVSTRAQALLDAQLADESIEGRPRTVLQSMKLDVDGFRRVAAAAAAGALQQPRRRRDAAARARSRSTAAELAGEATARRIPRADPRRGAAQPRLTRPPGP
jgi:hypothetical protein